VCDAVLDLCSITLSFHEHCRRIETLASSPWDDIEAEYSGDILSLSAQFGELSSQLSQMGGAAKQLAITLKAVVVDALRDFSSMHLSAVSASAKQLAAVEKDYENALRKLLHTPHGAKAKVQKAKKGKKVLTPAEVRARVSGLRKEYELARFDHRNLLNSVMSRHRYALMLNLCACFSGIETFFHVGYEASLAHRGFSRSIQLGVGLKTEREDARDERLAEKRRELEGVLDEKEELKEYWKLQAKFDDCQNNAQIETESKEDAGSSNSSSSSEERYNVDTYSGYLWKQSSSMKKDWKRRWFVLTDGELAYYRSSSSSSDTPPEREFVVNTMLCKVRERSDHDYRFVFELISPSRRVYVLQAQSQEAFIAWTSVLRNQVHRLLRKEQQGHSDDDEDEAEEMAAQKSRKRQLMEANPRCADCDKRDPEWVSINTGAVICIACCGIHRGLGTHVSKVRSLVLDEIPLSTLSLLQRLGNDLVNSVLEHSVADDYDKIDADSDQNAREKWIKGKYMFRLFVDAENELKGMSHDERNEELLKAVRDDGIARCFEALCFGAHIDHQFEDSSNRTALHEAAAGDLSDATELLLQNGAMQNIEDDDGFTARDLAEKNEATECLEILDYHIGFEERKTRKVRKTPKQTIDETAEEVEEEVEAEKEKEVSEVEQVQEQEQEAAQAEEDDVEVEVEVQGQKEQEVDNSGADDRRDSQAL